MVKKCFYSYMLVFLVVLTLLTWHNRSTAQDGYKVIILVVDDFSGRGSDLTKLLEQIESQVAELPPVDLENVQRIFSENESIVEVIKRSIYSNLDGSPLDNLEDANCAVQLPGFTAEGQYMAHRMAETGRPHGEVVEELLTNLVSKFGLSIDVQRVDTDGLNTSVIAVRIDEAIQTAITNGYKGIVVNMSFAIVPCESVSTFAAYEKLFKDNAQDVQAIRQSFQQFFIGANLNPEEEDSVRSLLENGEVSIIPVASAGNFGLDFPYYPAAWPEVLAVSAGDTGGQFSSNQRDSMSNWGEVMMPGEYNGLFGTSFAAPRLSALMALYLATYGSDTCHNSDGPALAYDRSARWQDPPPSITDAMTTGLHPCSDMESSVQGVLP